MKNTSSQKFLLATEFASISQEWQQLAQTAIASSKRMRKPALFNRWLHGRGHKHLDAHQAASRQTPMFILS